MISKKNKKTIMKNNPVLRKKNLLLKNLEKDIQIIKKCLRKDNIDTNNINMVNVDGYSFLFSDLIFSGTVPYVAREMCRGAYDFSNIEFKEGDTVIDIGGNVGMISIYLAKKFPFLKIYAYEPVKKNYENFLTNIKLNKIPDGTIHVENKAITKDGRNVNIVTDCTNTGGSAVAELEIHKFDIDFISEDIPSTTLNDIFKDNNIKSCKLLKIDCEGSEYEILYNTNKEFLEKCDHLRGEFHNSRKLKKQNLNSTDLISYCRQYIKDVYVELHEDN